MTGEYRFIGKATPRADANDVVTGSVQYLNDIKMAGMLHGKVLRSPHAHAFIKRVDKKKAEALPGVRPCSPGRTFPIGRGAPRAIRECSIERCASRVTP